MKTLVDKLDEYRSTEDAMRRTLLSAQKMADSMVKEAEDKKASVSGQAEAEANARIEEIRKEVELQEARVVAARVSTTAYLDQLKDLYTNQLEYIGSLSAMTTVPGEAEPNDPVREIEEKVAQILGDEPAVEAVAAPVDEPTVAIEALAAVGATGESSDTVVFDRLQFGKDYQFE